MDLEEDQIGFVKYSGKLVDEGYMDARKSAQALLGLDEAVRFYVYQQDPEKKIEEFEFPVKVKKGSWEIVIGAIVLAYGVKAAQKMAEKDFKDVGLTDLIKTALKAIQWVIKIGKHLGDITIKKFENVKFKSNNELIGIRNSEGEYLYIPRKYLEFYISTNPSLLKKLCGLVEDERTLSIGVMDGTDIEEVSVTTKYRRVFTRESDVEDTLVLPELLHGQDVVLEAEVTRGNETSNTIGIRYGGHIITGYPIHGSIVKFKPSLFLNSKVYGQVSRDAESKRPRILVSRVEPLQSDKDKSDLFENDQ